MKILTWNCNGAFRKKFEQLAAFDSDIAIIQECEDPSRSIDVRYSNWAVNYLWLGDTKNKGIGIFAKLDVRLTKLNWSNQHLGDSVKHFLPFLVNNETKILAIWLHQNNSGKFGYIGQLWKYLQVNKENMLNTIVVGDFNSNVKWDHRGRWWNHSDVVKDLNEIGIGSLYHIFTSEPQGKETKPTLYLHRKIFKPYHIDYCFAPKRQVDTLTNVIVGSFEDWILFSDHMPMVFEIDHMSETDN